MAPLLVAGVVAAMVAGPRPAFSSHLTFDADNFMWGTEAAVALSDAANPSINALASQSAINNTLHTAYVKFRIHSVFCTSDNWQTFTADCAMPSLNNPQVTFNLDQTVLFFKNNNWSMIPMINYNPGDNSISDTDVNNYVRFIDWFVTRYKADANIKYVELENCPNCEGRQPWTYSRLLSATNQAYDTVKTKFPDIQMGTPGFEYWLDESGGMAPMIEYFLDPANGAKFDFWAFHGYPLTERTGGGDMVPVPPTRTAVLNQYAGIPGILQIRAKLDANGWQDREIVDTEHTGILQTGQPITDQNDAIDAAYMVQQLLLKRTRYSGSNRALTGAIPLKTSPRGTTGEFAWSSLNSDGSTTRAVRAVALLWAKLDQYGYRSHVNGTFDNENQAWVEKFVNSAGDKELYVFFKPFSYRQGQRLALDGQSLSYNLSLTRAPFSATLTDISGNAASVTPAQTMSLSVENSPKFLEVLGPSLGLRVNGDSSATVTATNPVTVDYSIRGGQGREFFLALDAPAMGIPWAYRTAAGQWVPLPANLNDVTSFTTAPADGDYTLYTGTVPAGAYSLCLGYDTVSNGHLDTAAAVSDCVSATVH